MLIVKQAGDVLVVEVEGRYHVVKYDESRGRVTSCLPSDTPAGGGTWFADATDEGVYYVSRGRSRSAAMAGMRRAIKNSQRFQMCLDAITGKKD